MVDSTRRNLIYTIGVAGLTALTGCVERPSNAGPLGGTGTPEGTNNDTGLEETMTEDTDPDPEDETTDTAREFETDRHQVGRALSGPAWDGEETTGFCTLLQDAEGSQELVRDADDATQSFINETDFETAVVLYVESVGPNGCYDEIEVSELDIGDDGVLTGKAAAVDTSDRMTACQDVITYPAVLVRVRTDARIRSASLRVFDGWGQSSVVSSGDGKTRGLRRGDGFERNQ